MINGDLGALKGLMTGLMGYGRPSAKPHAAEDAPSTTAKAADNAVALSPMLGLLQADDANSLQESAGATPFDRFTQRLEKSLAHMGADFDRLLKLMGVGSDEAARTVHDLFGKFAEDPGGTTEPLAPPATDPGGEPGMVQAEQTRVTLEVRRISISINQGDRSVSVSVESARLAMETTRVALAPGAKAVGGSSVFQSEERGLFFSADGLGEEDGAQLMEKLGTMFGDPRALGGFNGRLALRPDLEKGVGDLEGDTGPINLILDIVEPLLSRASRDDKADEEHKEKAAEAPAAHSLNIQA